MKYFLLLIAVACTWGGAQGIYTNLQNQEPTVYDVNQLTSSNMPEEEWLQLENVSYNLTEAVYFENVFSGLADEIFVPLNTQNDSITVFVAQKSQGVLDVFNLINTQTDPAKTEEFINKYQDQVFKENHTYKGLVRYGIDLDNKEWRQLADTSPRLVDKFIILDENEEPGGMFSYIMLVIGLLLLITALRMIFKKEHPIVESE